MSSSRLRWAASAVALGSAGLLALGAGAAYAGPSTPGTGNGGGTITPTTTIPAGGISTAVPINFKTSGGCLATDGSEDYYYATVNGPGFPTDDTYTADTQTGISHSSGVGFNVAARLSFADLASEAKYTFKGNEEYTVKVYCADTFSTPSKDYFTGNVLVSSDASKVSFEAQPAPATTTVLTATPPSPQTAGTAVTLNAAVSTTSSAVVNGSVQFFTGTTSLGTAPVSGGTAQLANVTTLPVGTDSLSAVYTSADGLTASSTGTLSYTVNKGPAAGTTTALGVDKTAADTATPVTFTATITPGAAPGTVQFANGGSNLGNPVAVSGGKAVLTTTFTSPGSESVTATYLPTDPTDYQTSTSSAVAVTVTAPQYAPDPQTVIANVAAGTLVISTPYTPSAPLNLGTLKLNSTATELTASAPFQNIQITDTRSGNGPWTASATATDFSDGSGDSINAENLGLTALTPTYTAGNAQQSVQTFANPAAEPAVATSDTGTLGLKGGPHKIASAAQGDGTVTLNGTMTLNAPTSTKSGQYTSTVTFTIG